jgi:gas vesicle protein
MTSGSASALPNGKASKYFPPQQVNSTAMRGYGSQEKEGEFNMAEQEKPQCDFFTGLLIGGVLGALAGIFFAPISGKKLRSDIKEKSGEFLKDVKEIYADSSTKAKDIVEEAKHQAKELKKEAEGTGEKIAGKVQEKIGQVKKVLEV